MSLFGGLNLRVSSTKKDEDDGYAEKSISERQSSASSATSGLSGIAAENGATTTSASSGFGFLTTPPKTPEPEVASSSSNGSSAFNFLQTGTSSPVSTTPPPEPVPPTTSFSFLKPQEEKKDNSASAIAASLASKQSVDLLAPAAVIKPAVIKKKRGARLPGFARKDSVTNGSVASTSSVVSETDSKPEKQPEPVGLETNAENDKEIEQEETTLPAPAPSLLSGLTIHHEPDPVVAATEEVEQPPADDEKEQEQEQAQEREDTLPKTENAIHEDEGELEQSPGFSFMNKMPSSTEEKSDEVEVAKTVSDPPVVVEDEQPSLEKQREEEEQTEEGDDIPAGELGDLLRAFKKSAQEFASGLSNVSEKLMQNQVAMDRTKEEAESLDKQLKDFEDEQNKALEAEDFDKAERIQRTIDSVTRSVGEVDSKRLVLTREIETLNRDREKVYEEEVKSIELVSELLADCSAKETEEAKNMSIRVSKEIEEETARLDEEDDLLRIELDGIARDLQVVEKEQEQINAKVDEGTVALREQRAQWQAKVDEVDLEIQELERQLMEKQAKKSEYDSELLQVNNGIAAVRSRYESRLNELDTRRQAVDEKEAAAKLRSETIVTCRKELEERGNKASKVAEETEVSSVEISKQLILLVNIADRLKKEGLSRKSAGASPTGASSSSASTTAKIKTLSDEIEVAKQGINFSRREASQIESEIAEKNRTLLEFTNKLPALNQEKKLAVSSRNFKEAGRVAASIKEIVSEKEVIEESIKEAKEKLGDFERVINEKTQSIADKEAELRELQDSVDLAILKEVQAKRKSLLQTCSEIKACGSVAPNTFGAIVLYLVETEIKICETQAKNTSIRICGTEEMAQLEDVAAADDDTGADAEVEVDQVEGGVSNKEEGEGEEDEEEEEEEEEEIVNPSVVSREIERLETELMEAIEADDFEKAEVLDQDLQKLKTKLAKYQQKASESQEKQEEIEYQAGGPAQEEPSSDSEEQAGEAAQEEPSSDSESKQPVVEEGEVHRLASSEQGSIAIEDEEDDDDDEGEGDENEGGGEEAEQNH